MRRAICGQPASRVQATCACRCAGILPVSRNVARASCPCPVTARMAVLRVRKTAPLPGGPAGNGNLSLSLHQNRPMHRGAALSGARNEVLRARVRSGDARVLGVRLRLFYNERHVAPSTLGGVRLSVLCHLPRVAPALEISKRGRSDTATPGCAGKTTQAGVPVSPKRAPISRRLRAIGGAGLPAMPGQVPPGATRAGHWGRGDRRSAI